ncbi:MAG: hypothetical protein OEQ29_02465 [Alphaproteobacteria bacterium]|nr:hypothetical protein [Alphaproteobacteria bacterium]
MAGGTRTAWKVQLPSILALVEIGCGIIGFDEAACGVTILKRAN